MIQRPAALAVAGTAAVAAPPAALAVGLWAAAAQGGARLAALAVATGLAVGLHVLVRRGAPGRLHAREVMVLSAVSGGLLLSFSIALGLTGSSLNTALYEVSRADVALAALVVLVVAGVAVGHAVTAGQAARRVRRTLGRSRPQPRFADDRRGRSGDLGA